MRSYIASAAIFAASVAAGKTVFVGDGTVPLIYAAEPYPDSIYNSTQYNQTVIAGVTYNASNEWPHLNAKQYESILPACSSTCIKLALAADDCDVDDFFCHCTADQSAKIDSTVVPCLTSGPNALCTGEEIGELANFVHGSLCPYFIDTKEPTTSSSKGGDYWPVPTTSSSSSSEYWSIPTSSSSSSEAWGKPECSTSTSTSTTTYETWCSEATTLSWGSETWVVSEAATVTITNWPVTYTYTWTASASATESPVWATSTASAAAWAVSAAAAPASIATGTGAVWGAASGTGAYAATAAAQFTGAASHNKVAGAMVAGVAAAAALLI